MTPFAESRPDRNTRRRAVVYQVYPRSFQDSNGDGIGDLRGVTSRVPYLASLGVDALWMSPIFVSPNVDFGYDISDYTNIDPIFGSNDDFTALAHEAHRHGIEVLLDIVPSHTSIEHPWFREHPDWYYWSPIDGPPNNWQAMVGGPAWDRDPGSGGWYLHTYAKEQADLNWHNPEVADAMHDVLHTWVERGADGFRIDALHHLFSDAELRDNPNPDPKATGSLLDNRPYTVNRPETFPVLDEIRSAIPDSFLIAEASVPTSALPDYLRSVDLAFCFDFLHAPLDVTKLVGIIEEAAAIDGVAWVLSNHDHSRLVSRWGADTARAAALLLLTLPGAAFIYQGDEIGMLDGNGGEVAYDRVGRDRYRHPMQWAPGGGFTTGTPWLPMTDPLVHNVADQENDPDSMLSLYKRLIEFRRTLDGPFAMGPVTDKGFFFTRGEHVVGLNLSDDPMPVPQSVQGTIVISTDDQSTATTVAPKSGVVLSR